MFSPDIFGPPTTASLRNTRRRQRNIQDDSIKLPKAKRQRSTLRNDTFTPLDDADVNTISGKPNGDVGYNGQGIENIATPSIARQTRSSGHVDFQSLPLRGSKKSEKRVERGDGTVTLLKNDLYAVSQLPALPDQLRGDGGVSLNAIISREYGYALALTQTQALIWPYNAATSSSPAKDMFSFTLPYPSKQAEPLPLGSFVSPASPNQPGLVVIAPSSGKVTYWEDIANAAVLGLVRQKQNGVQGSVGLLSGETVTTIENAEPAGFMLTFSSSRVAHLTVRDPQGKPAINVQFLRGVGNGLPGGGLFGSVRNMFGGGGWRRDIAAVRAGRTRQRGQRDVIIGTKTGTFEIWDTFWSIGSSMRGQVDAKQALLKALKPTVSPDEPEHPYHFQVLDFAFRIDRKDKMELAITGNGAPTPIVALVILADHSSVNYYLVELILHSDGVDVDVVHPITCYKALLKHGNSWKPRLCLPKPGQMAFVIFQSAVVLFSLVRVEESPSSQLALETGSLPPPFQDCVDFRDEAYQVRGLGIEDQSADHKYASCALMIQGYGVIRVVAFPQKESEEVSQPAKVTAKSKIEQAVFYGTLKQNLLNFAIREEQPFSQQEVNDAALEIQEEILNSSSKFLLVTTPSLEHQLRKRAQALQDMAVYLKRQYPPLPRKTRWRLLAGAEKMASSRAIWRAEEAIMKRKPKDEKTFLTLMLHYIHENYKSEIDESKGETDQVRHWFIHDTKRVGIVISWSFQALKEVYKDGVKADKALVERISEANDISLAVLETAYQFRQANASLYGLGDEDLVDGVLRTGFQGVPEFWTSPKTGLSLTKDLLNTVQSTASKDWSKKGGDGPDPETLEKIGRDCPRLVEIYSHMVDERSLWCKAQDSEKVRHEGYELEASHVADRREMILKVSEIGLADDAFALAVKYKDMETLVSLLTETVGELSAKLQQPGLPKDEYDETVKRLDAWEDRLSFYFEKFGDDWAQALFTKQIEEGLLGSMLLQEQYQPYVTRFFERNPGFGKFCWMNDIIGEGDYREASNRLKNLAIEEESDLWSKKVELSMGRLAELASAESNHTGDASKRVGDGSDTVKTKFFKRQVALLNIQEALYSHVQLSLRGAIDETAEVQLAHEIFAEDMVKEFPALARVLKEGLSRLVAREVMSAEEVIDVLTLMDTVYHSEDEGSDIVGSEFHLALRALDFGDLGTTDPARKSLLEKIVWRRCMIRDDWVAINMTAKKDDAQIEAETDATALFRTLHAGFQDALFPNPSSIQEPFHPLPPSAVLNAGLDPDSFRSRFPDNEGQMRELLAQDLQKENERLVVFMEKGRLEKWWGGVVDRARRDVVGEADEADEVGERIGEEVGAVDQAGADGRAAARDEDVVMG